MAEAVYFEKDKPSLKPLDTGESLGVKAQDGRCYQNSFLALRKLKDGFYVEGYAIFYNDEICNLWYHGWVEHDGVIVDNYPGLGERFGIIYFPSKKYDYYEAMVMWDKWYTTGNPRPPFTTSWKRMAEVVQAYHNAMKPEDYKGNWKIRWPITAAKLALTFI